MESISSLEIKNSNFIKQISFKNSLDFWNMYHKAFGEIFSIDDNGNFNIVNYPKFEWNYKKTKELKFLFIFLIKLENKFKNKKIFYKRFLSNPFFYVFLTKNNKKFIDDFDELKDKMIDLSNNILKNSSEIHKRFFNIYNCRDFWDDYYYCNKF